MFSWGGKIDSDVDLGFSYTCTEQPFTKQPTKPTLFVSPFFLCPTFAHNVTANHIYMHIRMSRLSFVFFASTTHFTYLRAIFSSISKCDELKKSTGKKKKRNYHTYHTQYTNRQTRIHTNTEQNFSTYVVFFLSMTNVPNILRTVLVLKLTLKRELKFNRNCF